MNKWSTYIWLLVMPISVAGQPNCDEYKPAVDAYKYKACLTLLEAYNHYEFSKEYNDILDEVIEIDSSFALAYQLRSDPYLKSGNFIKWKVLIDKAVKYNPTDYLPHRAFGRFLFFRDYQGAIKDIKRLMNLDSEYVISILSSKYDLRFVMALCYKALDDKIKSLKIMEDLLHSEVYWPEKYDILHLGILYYELGMYQDAESTLLIHETNFNLAETQYYLGKIYQQLNDIELAQYHFQRGLLLYNKGVSMKNKYVTLMDEISLDDITTEIKTQ